MRNEKIKSVIKQKAMRPGVVLLFTVAAMLMLGLMLGGCSSKSMKYSESEIAGYPPEIQDDIKSNRITLGMTPAQVRYAWGPPSYEIYLEPTNDGKEHIQWIYKEWHGFTETKLDFINGKLREITSNDPEIKKTL